MRQCTGFQKSPRPAAWQYAWHFLLTILLLQTFKPLFRNAGTQPVDVESGFWGYLYFIVLSLSSLFLFLFYFKKALISIWNGRLLWVFFLWAACSILWSVSPLTSLKQVAALGLIFLYACFVHLEFDLECFLAILFWALLVSLCLSLFVSVFFPELGITVVARIETGWRGVFIHKNYLGIFSSLNIMVILELINRKNGLLFKSVLILGFAVSAVTLLGSRATASLIVLAAVLLAKLFFRLLRKYHRKVSVFFLLALLAGIALTDFVFKNHREILIEYFRKDDTLTGRIELWSNLMPYIEEKWVLGYGFNGFWTDDNTSAQILRGMMNDWQVPHAHNTYLDLLLNVGIIGLALFLMILLLSLFRALKLFFMKGAGGSFFVSLLFFLALINISDSRFLRGFNIWWLLLMIAYLYLRESCKNEAGNLRHNL